MTNLPDFSVCTRPASRSVAKCADMVGLETAKCSESSPAVIGFLRSSCNTRRRVGSESALNTPLTNRYLANHLIDCKWPRQLGAGVTPAQGSLKPTVGFTFDKVI